ncbi:MAG: hypothetical protein GC179_07625 [Anaerolineaceae bacterium]|nr:hypothetical protein [Anaerolineaceae bacterium]
MSQKDSRSIMTLMKDNWSNYLINTIALIALTYFVLFVAPIGGTLYWLYVDSNPTMIGDAVCKGIPVISLCLLIFWLLFGIKKYKSPNRIRLFLMPLMTGCCLIFFSLGRLTPNSTKHLAELRSGIRLYRVALWVSGGSAGTSDVLFQCDPLGILCSVMCSIYTDNSNFISQKISIKFEETTQIVSMMDGDNVLCHSENNS